MSLLRVLVSWLAILALAFVNGAFRELVLVPALGYPWALLLSGLVLCACILAIAYLALRRREVRTALQAFGIGASWLALTLVFEFTFGRLVQGKSWNDILGAYTFARGNLWPVVLLVVLLAPAAIRAIQVARAANRDA